MTVLCSLYDERQRLNNDILRLLTDNAAAMEAVDTLWQQQHYNTPHSRANIVYADKQLQAPADRPGSLKLVNIKQEASTDKQSNTGHAVQQSLPALLEKLEANLARELCHISEQDHVTMTHLLKPVQVDCYTFAIPPCNVDKFVLAVSHSLLGWAGLCRAVPCRAVLCCAVLQVSACCLMLTTR